MPDYKQLIERLRDLARTEDERGGLLDNAPANTIRESIGRIAGLESALATEREKGADAVKFAEAQYEEVCAERDRLLAISEKAVYMAHCYSCGLDESNSATAECPTVCRNCGSTDLSQYIKLRPQDFAVLQEAQRRATEPQNGRRYMEDGEPGGTCPCGKPDPGIKPEGGCWCTEDGK
jgi:hypothetical protein